MEKNYELDEAIFQTPNENDFQSFLEERESKANWFSQPVNSVYISVNEDSSTQATKEAIYTAELESGTIHLRNIAIPSLLERARISGYALGELSSNCFCDVVNMCLLISREISKIRVQDEKVAAFNAKSYCVVSTPNVYESTSDAILKAYGKGQFEQGFWSHKCSYATYSVAMPCNEYQSLFKKKHLDFSEIMLSLSVMTSDASYSGVNIYPIITGITNGGKHYRLPILGDVRMEHKGNASIEKHKENISIAFAQYNKSSERIAELDKFVLNYPLNAFCNALKKVGIGKKEAASAVDQVAVIYGNKQPASVADLYFQACNLTMGITNPMDIMRLEESIARLLKLSDKAWNEFDRPVNVWKLNEI